MVSNINRAKQFMSFDALRGYHDIINEVNKITQPKKELGEYKINILNQKLIKMEKNDIVTITYYDKDCYRTIRGMVSSIDNAYKTVTVITTKIPFDDIYDIEL